MPLCSTLIKITESCFSEFKDTELSFAISQAIDTEKSTKAPYSLMKISFDLLIKNALEDEEIAEQVKKIIIKEPLDFSNLHYFERQPELLNIAFETSFQESCGLFGLDIRNTTCRLTLNGKRIAEFLITEEFEWPKKYVMFAFKRKLRLFRVSVTDSPLGRETQCQKLERFLEELEEESHLKKGNCTIDCYFQKEFHFKNQKGSHIYFKKYEVLEMCKHEKMRRLDGSDFK